MMINFYSLPNDILREIFLFDSTYKDIFTNSVLPLIPLHCVYNVQHLIFRAKEIASDRSYLIYDCYVNMEEGYVYGKMLEAHQNDFLNQNDVIKGKETKGKDKGKEHLKLCFTILLMNLPMFLLAS